MGFSLDEQETSLMWDPTTGRWDIMTNVPKHIRLYTRMAEAHSVIPTISEEGRLRVVLPEKAISHRRPSTRVMSPEQREAARQRLQRMREQRKKRL